MHLYMANYRCVKHNEVTQIKAEIMQTYDLLIFAITRSNGSIFAHGCYVTSMSVEGNWMAITHSLNSD